MQEEGQSGGLAAKQAGVSDLEELRDKYEGKLTTSLYVGTLIVAVIALVFALAILYISNYQDLAKVTIPASILSVLLVSSSSLLLLAQLTSTLTSVKIKFLIGFFGSTILGVGIVIVRASVSLFITILAMIAILPRDTGQKPAILAVVLIIAHIGGRFAFLDHSSYPQIAEFLRVHITAF